ncbi:hypothetical protein SAMN04487852_106197, partial [Prevotella sp. tf2-5]
GVKTVTSKPSCTNCPNAFASSHPFSCCFAVLTGVLLVEIVTYTVGDVVGE